ncbi:glycerophosphodiester phosphodiesterase [Planococcus faecalis]|uniref:Glycerophosphodiester phosphodiesterase n=1 Tax=Planococcus faecalis TaxID=1598147 RepID=A0ABN4XL85_9BACL|nr:glycerophosphodiester phosphodiesterase [Planococcus faecalis]AQU78433.1 glycerophosphodiester phosphodiesterase [Planococcus faecalis]OHX52375.1 glycerophosphodiester phosphodiesterase [Planococcus faecalis]
MKSLKKVSYSLLILLLLSTVFTFSSTPSFAKLQAPLLNPNKILNVAHRGASGYAPEHTLVSYELGEDLHGDYIEIDLQMTKDGVLIAMHDEKVDRTTNGTGYVKDMTLAEIKQLDAGSWFNEAYPEQAKAEYVGLKVPTLEEVFQEFGRGARYYIETKAPEVYPGMEEELLRVLTKYKMIGQNAPSSKFLVQSFSQESLLKMHALNPKVPLVQLLSYSGPATITDEQIAEIKEYAIGVGPSFKRIDRAYVEKVRENDLLIHPYTVNTKEDMERLLDWGVTGMFTNYPDLLNEVLKGKK